MQLEIITPDKELFNGEADSIVLPGIEGSLGIWNNHAPLITALKAGKVEIKDAGKAQDFDIKGGVVEVLNNRVVVLAE